MKRASSMESEVKEGVRITRGGGDKRGATSNSSVCMNSVACSSPLSIFSTSRRSSRSPLHARSRNEARSSGAHLSAASQSSLIFRRRSGLIFRFLSVVKHNADEQQQSKLQCYFIATITNAL